MSFIPSAVKEVLNENTLSGIYNTIGNVVMCDENFAKALNTAIAGCKNFIITENELHFYIFPRILLCHLRLQYILLCL